MGQATGQFQATNVVALFQGFLTGDRTNRLITRAAQNCQVSYNPANPGLFTLQLNNVSADDCNFMIKVGQFQAVPGNAVFGVAVAFPPVGNPGGIPNSNYINFQ